MALVSGPVKAGRFIAAVTAVLVSASSALGNGDEFYRFNALDGKALDSQVIFAGIVKDAEGNHLPDVKITIGVVAPTMYGDKLVTFNAYTNVAGRYRALDVASVVSTLEEVEMTVDPALVEVTVAKEGYAVTRKLNRSRGGQKFGLFEVDFTMRKIPASPG